MKKVAFGLAAASLLLSGCSFPGQSGSNGQSAAFLRSTDGGVTFTPKVTIDEKTNFASADILSLAFHPQNTQGVFLGTREDGLLMTEDNGEHWKKINYPPTKVYGLVSTGGNPFRLFATGEWQGRGKIYRSDDNGENWKEIYTEPSDGVVILSLAVSPSDSRLLYAGTSAGVIVKTSDGGDTWQNINTGNATVNKPILSMAFDAIQNNLVYFVISGKGILTWDGEKFLDESAMNSFSQNSAVASATSIGVDPSRSGTVYAGTTHGLFRSADFGKTWTALNIIESSKQFPIRSVAVSPNNSNELMYSSALAVYRSIDGGVHWSTYQLQGSRPAGLIRYDAQNTGVVYVGLRSPQ